MSSIQVGWNAALNHYNDAAIQTAQTDFTQRNEYYQMLQLYYDNLIFNKLIQYSQKYKALQKYEHIRSLYNPTRRLVNFYANKVYPGVLSEDGSSLPDGVSLAIPFAKDTRPEIKQAIAQIWQWSNFQSKKSLFVRFGGMFGSVLAEVTDDLEHGKVSINVVKPGDVYAIELDAAGNVKSYALQYKVRDETQNTTYTYKKEVDGREIRHYRDEQLERVVQHPYGFCPAVWVKIQDNGTDFGEPLIFESLERMNELNALVAHIIDQIHITADAPVMLWGATIPQSMYNQEKRTEEQRKNSQEQMRMMSSPAQGRVDSLASGLDMQKADISVGRLMAEIEACHPELTLYKELRGMTQVTGPAASRLVDDVGGAVIEAQALYDQQLIKLFQMCLTIGGMRANERAWPNLNRQQAKFLPFGLDSYEAGDLDFAIMPRPILQPTRLEQAQAKQAMYASIKAATDAGIPLDLALEEEGWPEDKIARVREEEERARQAQMIPDDELPMDNEPETDEEEDNDDES
jgi:hypothetical protein